MIDVVFQSMATRLSEQSGPPHALVLHTTPLIGIGQQHTVI